MEAPWIYVLAAGSLILLLPDGAADETRGESEPVRRGVVLSPTGTGGPGTALTAADAESPRPSASRDEMAREAFTTEGRYYVSASAILDALEEENSSESPASERND